MGNKIYFKMPENSYCAGVDSNLKKGTEIFAPEYHFGMVLQNYKPLAVFDKSIKLNAKSVPGIKLPLFGAVKDVRVRFFPYGITGNFIADNFTFELKSGRRAKATFTVGYKISIKDPWKATEIHSFIGGYTLNDDGSLTRPAYMNKYVLKAVANELAESEAKGENWRYVVDPSQSGTPRDALITKIKIRNALKHIFEKMGYEIEVTSEEIVNIDYAE